MIKQYHPHLAGAVIACMLILAPEKKRNTQPKPGKKQTIARISLVSDRIKAAVEAVMEGRAPDFMLEIKEEYWDLFSLSERDALCDHLLCHAGWDEDAGRFYYRDHDVQEFRVIIERHGFWMPDLRLLADTVAKVSEQRKLFTPEAGSLLRRVK